MYFHIFNSFYKKSILLLSLIIVIFSIKIIVDNLDKIKKIFKKRNDSVIILFFLSIIFFCLYYFSSNNYELILNKNTNINLFIYHKSYYFLSVIFFICFSNFFFDKNGKLVFRLINLIILSLLATSFIYYVYIVEDPAHLGLFNPHPYLFFFDDNRSSKLQHAYMLFLINIIIVRSYLYKANNVDYYLIVSNLAFAFLIFSKLFILAIYGYLILIFIINPNFNLFKKLLTIFLKSIFLIFIISTMIKITTTKNFSLPHSFAIKFSHVISTISPGYMEAIIKDFKTKLNSNSLSSLEKYKDTQEKNLYNYYDSTIHRIKKIQFCSDNIFNYNKSLDIIEYSTNNEKTKKHLDFFYGGNTAQVNCEGTITQLLFTNFWIGSIVLIIFFYYFYTNVRQMKKYNSIILLSIILISFAHHTFENPSTFLIIAMLLSGYFEKKKTL